MATILLLWEAARILRKISMHDLKLVNISPLTVIYWAPLPRNPAKICISTQGCIIKTVAKDLYESLNMLLLASVSGIASVSGMVLASVSGLCSVLVLALVSGILSAVTKCAMEITYNFCALLLRVSVDHDGNVRGQQLDLSWTKCESEEAHITVGQQMVMETARTVYNLQGRSLGTLPTESFQFPKIVLYAKFSLWSL